MQLKAGCDITVEAPEPCACIAMLRPRSGDAQWLASEQYLFDPPLSPVEHVDAFGNLGQRFVAPAGRLRIRVEAVVHVADHLAVDEAAPRTPVEDMPADALQFLLASRYCPSDRLVDRAHEIVQGVAPGYAEADAITRWIHANLRYQYGVSNESTDALDTLRDGAGVCRDFSHVGIALCRALRIPARMVVGYLHRLDPMDMHAWFEAFVGGRWYAFDATQDGPRGGRIVVAYGRDAADVAFISNFGTLETREMKVWVEALGAADEPAAGG